MMALPSVSIIEPRGGSNPEDEVAANLDTKRKSPFAEHPVNKI